MPINNNTGSALQDGINDVERQSVMTFWSMASAPLYVGGDVYFMDNSAVSILTNPEVIAIDQAAVIPVRITSGNSQVWKKVINGVTYAAVRRGGGVVPGSYGRPTGVVIGPVGRGRVRRSATVWRRGPVT
jgi:hypothetical protein